MKLSSQKLDLNGSKLKIAIIFSTFNDKIGNILLNNTLNHLKNFKVFSKNIKVVKVPGALEIPMAAKYVTKKKNVDAIIALGVVIKGDTPHFELVINESHRALMDLNLSQDIPIIFGILTAFTPDQALKRAEVKGLNKAKEFAEAAIIMGSLKSSIK